MERVGSFKDTRKKGLILKALARCRSIGHRRVPPPSHSPKTAPGGYFSVCVGPDKERFAIKTECANHPRFKLLLDEAEREYGFTSEGPLELPCNVDLFHQVLWEMEQEAAEPPRWSFAASPMCSFTKGHGGYQILSPSRLVGRGRAKSTCCHAI